MIYPLLNQIKFHCIKHPIVNMSAVGSISLFDDKSYIKYPYTNLDVISANIVNMSKKYLIRLYVCDRNLDPLISYNKTELIADNILKDMGVDNYNVTYFNVDFQDEVDGVYVDFEFEIPVVGNCTYNTLFDNILLEDGSFIMQENGDLISLEN